MLRCAELHCSALYCSTLHHTALPYNTLHCTNQIYAALHYTTLRGQVQAAAHTYAAVHLIVNY